MYVRHHKDPFGQRFIPSVWPYKRMNHLWLVLVFVLLTSLFIYFGSFVFFVYLVDLGTPPTLNQKNAKQEHLTEVKMMDHTLSPTEMKKMFFEEGVVGPFKMFAKPDLTSFLSKKGRSLWAHKESHTNQKSIF